MKRTNLILLLFLFLSVWRVPVSWADFSIRGKPQDLHLYGTKGNPPVIVSSGDGGWMSISVDLAKILANRGYFVIGFDSKAYLESFTTKDSTLKTEEVQQDYQALLEYAKQAGQPLPILAGISEGAGLSLLAAAHPANQAKMQGVLLVGLPNENELGWRWGDFKIYFTHKTPNEPTFHASDFMAKVSPVPLAEIHSTHDEFIGLEDEKKLIDLARAPKKMWVVEAKNHRFSGSHEELEGALNEALQWMKAQGR